MMNRRSFLTGLGSLVAAPAIVPYASLMPVRGIVMTIDKYAVPIGFDEYEASMWRKLMQVAWVKERLGRPPGRIIEQALRTGTLPWWLQHAEKM